MSFGQRLGSNECRLQVGGVYTNGLAERFEEHREITSIDGNCLCFKVVSGKRDGSIGNCQVQSFWIWSRGKIK